jgi:hypothetical protein
MSYDKFTFKIRTKAGTTIDQVTIGALTRQEAEQRLLKMYNECKIVECNTRNAPVAAVDPSPATTSLPTYEQLQGKLYG